MMVVPRTLGLLVALTWILGCTEQPPDDDAGDDDAGDDDAGDDDVGDDDSGDDDTGDDDGGDDDSGDDDTEPGQADGLVMMVYYQSPDGVGGTIEGAYLAAQFVDVISEPSGMLEYTYPAGVDECALTLYDYADMTGGVPGVYDYLSAGTLTVSGPSGTLVPPLLDLGGGVWIYRMDLIPWADLQFDSVYDVTASGDAFPPFDALGSLVMPASLHMTSPPMGDPLHLNGDLAVSWVGGDPGELVLFLTVSSPAQEYGTVVCEMANDGSFIIPGSLTAQAPDGTVSLVLAQTTRTTVESSGRWIELTAMVNQYADGTKP